MDDYSGVVADLVWDEIVYALGGREPRTIWDLRRLARRFGGELVFTRRRKATENRGGFIVVRLSRKPGRVWRHALHEIAENALRWEGREPCVAPGVEMHQVARIVERR